MTLRIHRDAARAGDSNSQFGTAATIVTVYDRIPLRLVVDLWRMYQKAFEEIRPLAVQEHLMTAETFGDVMADRRIKKFVVTNDAEVIGLSVMTERLHAWPLVAPPFFERKYPGRRIFYVGFVAVPPKRQGVFVTLIDRMYQDVIAADGIAVMDFCKFNAEQKRLHLVTARLLASKNPNMRHETIDFQQWDAYDFRGDQEHG